MPGITTSSGDRAYHRMRVENPRPGPASVNGEDVPRAWDPATPPYWNVRQITATAAADERAVPAGTVLSQPALVVVGDYRADVTTASRLVDEDGQVFELVGVESPDGRKRELVARGVATAPPEVRP